VSATPATSPDDFDILIEKHRSKSVTYAVFGETFNVLLASIGNAVKAVTTRSDTAIAALEARVAELESRPTGVAYKGVWDASEVYERGHFVTRAGSIWHCERDHNRGILPGAGDGWRLAVKKGSDGKDGKDLR
jgi:hypothetical protein